MYVDYLSKETIYTEHEVCRILGITPKYLKQLMIAEKITVVIRGETWGITNTSLVSYWNSAHRRPFNPRTQRKPHKRYRKSLHFTETDLSAPETLDL